MCHRRTGVGADGLIYLSADRATDGAIDIYNADGGWAQKSGNGLRIAAVHRRLTYRKQRVFSFRTGSGIDRVTLGRRIPGGYVATAQLGKPDFLTARVPVRTRRKYLINSPLKVGPLSLPVTCLSVGNPHTVLLVDNLDFDWKQLGGDIENAPPFPEGTNVEFVKVLSRRRLRVGEWERGAGATCSSGTGAAAAACAMVRLGLVDRRCRVEFEAGVLAVDWSADTNIIELTGPARFVMEGSFAFQ